MKRKYTVLLIMSVTLNIVLGVYFFQHSSVPVADVQGEDSKWEYTVMHSQHERYVVARYPFTDKDSSFQCGWKVTIKPASDGSMVPSVGTPFIEWDVAKFARKI